MNYQDLFQSLKGVGELNLNSLSIGVPDFDYILKPINCNNSYVQDDIVRMLTESRNTNFDSFLTFFDSTTERTRKWLVTNVAQDPSRILFSVQNLHSGSLYGYMGLAFGTDDCQRIEGDAIVRYSPLHKPGLMKKAFTRLVSWVHDEIGIQQVWIRVLSDNQAIKFYQKCGFTCVHENILFEVRNELDQIIELREESDLENYPCSSRTLTYMKYNK